MEQLIHLSLVLKEERWTDNRENNITEIIKIWMCSTYLKSTLGAFLEFVIMFESHHNGFVTINLYGRKIQVK